MPIKPSVSLLIDRPKRPALPQPGSPLHTLLHTPGVLALDHRYYINTARTPMALAEMSIWRYDHHDRLVQEQLVGLPKGKVAMARDPQHGAAIAAMNSNIYDVVCITDDVLDLTDATRDAYVHVLWMAEGWVAFDEKTVSHGLLHWPWTKAAGPITAHDIQNAAASINWRRFCLPFLPEPSSAHEALIERRHAQRLVDHTLTIHKASGLTQLEHIDWTATFPS